MNFPFPINYNLIDLKVQISTNYNKMILHLFVLYSMFALNRYHFTYHKGNNPYETDIKMYTFINK